MPVDSNESLRLKPGKVAGDQFADRANLRRQFLVAHAQLKSKPILTLRATQYPGNQAITHSSERQFLDDSHQPAEPRAHDLQDLERYFRILDAKCAKLLARDEQQFGRFYGRPRRRVRSTVEDRQFRHRATWTFECENLFTPIG